MRGLNRISPKPAFLFDGFLGVFLFDETRNTIYGKVRGESVSWASVSFHLFRALESVCLHGHVIPNPEWASAY